MGNDARPRGIVRDIMTRSDIVRTQPGGVMTIEEPTFVDNEDHYTVPERAVVTVVDVTDGGDDNTIVLRLPTGPENVGRYTTVAVIISGQDECKCTITGYAPNEMAALGVEVDNGIYTFVCVGSTEAGDGQAGWMPVAVMNL